MLRRGVDLQREHIRPGIVAHRVEVHLRHRDHRQVEFGRQQRVLVVNRPGELAAHRVDDHAATAHQHRVGRLGQRVVHPVTRKLVAPQVLAGRQHEAAAFHRDVRHRGGPGVAVVGRRCAVDCHALLVHRHAQGRHVVFPADHRAQLAPGRVHGLERGAVPEAPDQALQRGRHELAVLTQDLSLRAQIDRGAVQRAAVALDDAHHDVHVMLRGGLGQQRDLRSVHRDGRVEIKFVLGAPLRRASAEVDVKIRALGVAPEVCLGEDDELRALRGGLRHERQCALHGGGRVQQDGGALCDGGGQFHGVSSVARMGGVALWFGVVGGQQASVLLVHLG